MPRTVLISLIPLVVVLLSCGMFTSTQAGEPTQVAKLAQNAPTAARIAVPAQFPREVATSRPLSPLVGDTSMEEKIMHSSVVVRGTMTSYSSTIVVDPDNRHRVVLNFSLNVSEYLKGTGPSSIVVIWVDGKSYNTSTEANDAKSVILAERDGQWDDREALFFLHEGFSGFGNLLEEQLRPADHLLLGLGARDYHDDRYSLHSQTNKVWLPAVSSATSTGDNQSFLLDVPPASETVTLIDLKKRIREVTAELNSGDGSEAHRQCVASKYEYMRNMRNFTEEMGRPYTAWNVDHSPISGQTAGTVLDQDETYGRYPDIKVKTWLDGIDSALFKIDNSTSTPIDMDGDGEYDEIKYDQFVKLARPLPAGEYKFDLKESRPAFALCDYVVSNEWMVTVSAPEGALHEFFFDPVTVGSAVAADASNGVLKPTSFTDTNGAPATVESISYEPPSTGLEPAPGSNRGQAGRVRVKVVPWSIMSGRVLDFIGLDGTVSLSLNVTNSAVEDATNTLIWSVSSQPWEDGDMLMVRIRRAAP